MSGVVIEKLWGVSNQNACDDHGGSWSVPYLIECAKNLPVMDIPLEHLCISRKLGSAMTLRTFVSHMMHVRDADLKFPIILDEDGNIFDGLHRVAKALLEGRKTIKAVRFEINPEQTVCGKDE